MGGLMKPWQWVQLGFGSFILLVWGTAVLVDITKTDYMVPPELHYGCTLLITAVLGSSAILAKMTGGNDGNGNGGSK